MTRKFVKRSIFFLDPITADSVSLNDGIQGKRRDEKRGEGSLYGDAPTITVIYAKLTATPGPIHSIHTRQMVF